MTDRMRSAVYWWAPLLPLTAVWALTLWPNWLVMLGIAASILLILKSAVLREYIQIAARPRWIQVGLWFLAWPGLNARDFFDATQAKPPTARATEWFAALFKTALGVLLIRWWTPVATAWHPLLGGWVALAGLLMLFHFGGFHLLALMWKSYGRQIRPIMHQPLRATSVSDFWSHRWNLAFRDFANQFVMRPLARRWGASVAMWGCFVFSGLVHELAISVPARAGYGLPTAYFLLQAVGVSFERSRAGRRLRLAAGWRGWLFALLVIGPPAFFLFHPPFVTTVILPLVGSAGNIP